MANYSVSEDALFREFENIRECGGYKYFEAYAQPRYSRIANCVAFLPLSE